jgi:hypothetical protein
MNDAIAVARSVSRASLAPRRQPRHHLAELWLAQLAETHAQALAERQGVVLGALLALGLLLATRLAGFPLARLNV